MKNLPAKLAALVAKAKEAQPSTEIALKALHSLDYTSLNDDDTAEKIGAFLTKADQGDLGHTAAVCVNPQFVTQAFNAVALKGINVATVINFPSGKGTPEQTVAEVKAALAAGANEIDIVFDYDSFLKGDKDTAIKLLEACSASKGKATMKVILETAAFEDFHDLDYACTVAIASGADFLKTSTGKSKLGGASLEAAAVMLKAIADFRLEKKFASIKISGGVKTVTDAAQYMALADSVMGAGWAANPANFRIGSSSTMNDILKTLGREQKAATADTPKGPAY